MVHAQRNPCALPCCPAVHAARTPHPSALRLYHVLHAVSTQKPLGLTVHVVTCCAQPQPLAPAPSATPCILHAPRLLRQHCALATPPAGPSGACMSRCAHCTAPGQNVLANRTMLDAPVAACCRNARDDLFKPQTLALSLCAATCTHSCKHPQNSWAVTLHHGFHNVRIPQPLHIYMFARSECCSPP
jgi:hypothetical protein